MEDYQLAHKCRLEDIDILLSGQNKRFTAAAHLGGVAIECRLKALIIVYHKIKQWEDLSKRAKDPRYGQPISRTGHSLVSGVRMMAEIYSKAKADPLFLKHLNNLNFPTGASALDFIALRYSSSQINAATMVGWKESLTYVLGWLEKNEAMI